MSSFLGTFVCTIATSDPILPPPIPYQDSFIVGGSGGTITGYPASVAQDGSGGATPDSFQATINLDAGTSFDVAQVQYQKYSAVFIVYDCYGNLQSPPTAPGGCSG